MLYSCFFIKKNGLLVAAFVLSLFCSTAKSEIIFPTVPINLKNIHMHPNDQKHLVVQKFHQKLKEQSFGSARKLKILANSAYENAISAGVSDFLTSLVVRNAYYGSYGRLAKICEFIAKNAVSGDYGLAMQMVLAEALSKNGPISIEETYKGLKSIGQVDVTVYDSKSKTVISSHSLKTIYSENANYKIHKLNRLIKSAIDQLAGKNGEKPESGSKKYVEIMIIGSTNPLYNLDKIQLKNILIDGKFTSKRLHFIDGILISNGTGQVEFLGDEILNPQG